MFFFSFNLLILKNTHIAQNLYTKFMFSHHSFLILGEGSPADILTLVKGGLEVSDFSFSFRQGVDDRGKATTRVYAGTLSITLSQLPN